MRTGDTEYWETVADRSWGRYITGVETATIEKALDASAGPGHALDVGCGGGRWTGLVLSRGWSVVAVDVDPVAVATCAERNPTATCLLVDAGDEALSAADRSVSLVLCIEVIAVAHRSWFLEEASRVLAPGGRMVLVMWNRTSIRGRIADVVSRVRHRTPHTFYTTPYREWRRRLRAAGLEVEAEVGLCWFPFGRASNSRIVPVCVALERRFGLDRLPSLSPWVLVTAVRPAG